MVIPYRPNLPTVLAGHDARYAAGFMTAALGRRPVFEAHAWVFSNVTLSQPALRIRPTTLATCTRYAETHHLGPDAVPSCVIVAARRP